MRLSACFLSCLLSRPQTATALQRNTRPSTHDAPLSVYGQETVRPVPLPHYRAGKVSFFVHPYQTTTKFCNLINALTNLGTSKIMYKDFWCLKSLFSLSKIRQIPVTVFSLPGLSYCRIFAFLLTQKREDGIILWSKRIFPCGTTAGNHELVNQNRGVALSCPLANSVVLQKAV